jgi:primosomal protein N'
MLLSIIPIDSSIDDEGLTYFAKDILKKELHIGSLVNIPIKENIRYGIVADILSPTTEEIPASIDIRSIVSIACSTPLLAPYQFRLIHALAHRHFVHAHKVLALFLPKFIFNTLEKKAFEPMITVTDYESRATGKFRNSKLETRNLISFFHNTKNVSLSEYIQDFLKKYSNNTAIIFPDDLLLSQELQHLTGIEKNATVVKNSHTYTRRYKTWLEARQKKNPILI